MAAKNFSTPRCYVREQIEVPVSFAPAGGGAPTAIQGAGIASVARTAAGTFLVTFKDKFMQLVSATGTIQLNAAGDSDVQIGAVDLSAKTAVVRTMTAGAAADIAANANNRVNLLFVFRNSSIPTGS
jgi:uncharacterized protein with beta-barrel porin domain